MKKTIIHYENANKIDFVMCHIVIGKVLQHFYDRGFPSIGECFFLKDYDGWRIQGRHNKTSISFYVTKLP